MNCAISAYHVKYVSTIKFFNSKNKYEKYRIRTKHVRNC